MGGSSVLFSGSPVPALSNGALGDCPYGQYQNPSLVLTAESFSVAVSLVFSPGFPPTTCMEGRDDRKMANGVGKHKLLVIGPTEPWSVREKLCLATSVMKSGDQNWVSVSRTIKPFAEQGRPPDWFSQKHCASKYSELLETTEAPKRKRGEKGEVVETVEDVIVRRLTGERIEELKKLIKETRETHRKLKREAELIQAGHLDSKLEELWEDIQL
ncbi:Bromodomain-containing protein 8, partial [Ameca splendens]